MPNLPAHLHALRSGNFGKESMKHIILTVLLTLGVVGGLTYGIAERRHERWRHHSRFKEQVAEICVDATLRTLKNHSAVRDVNDRPFP